MAALPKDIQDSFTVFYNDIQAAKVNSVLEISNAMGMNPQGITEILEYASTLDNSELLTHILVELLRTFDLENVDILHLPRVALFCGSLVEMGANPEPGLEKIFNNCKALLSRALKVVSILKQHSIVYQEALAVPNELLDRLLKVTQDITLDDIKAWKLFKFAVLPLMAILARSKNCRDLIRQDELFVTAMKTMVNLEGEKTSLKSSTYYVKAILEVAEGFELTVLHPILRQGCVVEPVAIQNCFQFFTLLQNALKNKPWGQKVTEDRDDVAKTVAIAKGEAEISMGGFYDANQWNYYHWTKLNDKNKPIQIDGHLPVQEILSFGDGATQVPVVVLDEARSFGKWNANLFCPIHPALRSAVIIKRYLSPEEVDGFVNQISNYTGIVSEPKTVKTEEERLAEAKKELARKGSLLMVEIMREKYPEYKTRIYYDEETERIFTGMKEITVSLTVINYTGVKSSLVFHKWEIFVVPEDEEGIQMFSMCTGTQPEDALMNGGLDWIDGVFDPVVRGLVLTKAKPNAQLATTRTNGTQIKKWALYSGEIKITNLNDALQLTDLSQENEEIFRKSIDSNPMSIILPPLLDFLNEADDDLNLAWVKVYLARTKDGEFSGEIVINNSHVPDGLEILKSKFTWPAQIPIEGMLSFRQFCLLKVTGISKK